jgi:hypothetical protein
MNIKYATEVLGKRPSNKVWNHIPTLRYWYVYRKSMCEDKESLLQATAWEHRFQLLQVQSLVNWLEEIVSMTNDPLTKKLVSNSIERHELDKLIHTRNLFPNPQWFNEYRKK